MNAKELKMFLEKELVEGLCDSYEDRLFKLAVLEAMSGVIDKDSPIGEQMIHLLDSVNDVLQKAGMIPEGNTFYKM